MERVCCIEHADGSHSRLWRGGGGGAWKGIAAVSKEAERGNEITPRSSQAGRESER